PATTSPTTLRSAAAPSRPSSSTKPKTSWSTAAASSTCPKATPASTSSPTKPAEERHAHDHHYERGWVSNDPRVSPSEPILDRVRGGDDCPGRAHCGQRSRYRSRSDPPEPGPGHALGGELGRKPVARHARGPVAR